jgi:riboflavin kinase/FMN adenylyltransferase
MPTVIPTPAPSAHASPLIPARLDDVPRELTGGVIAVGNFDGVHQGHRALLAVARAEADRRGVPAVVLTFEPHPRNYFRAAEPVFRLTPLAAKARLLKVLGVDGLVVADFDRALAEMPAAAFIGDILVGKLKPVAAVVGFNFHFGKGRFGSPAALSEAGAANGFAVTVVGEVSAGPGRAPLSSSAIRHHLAEGDVAAANADLGYRWFVIATVIPGERRGRELGFPTANLKLDPDCRLRHGIYAVRLQRADGTVLDAVASFGRRPTFDNGAPLLEVYVFDFSGDLYGERVAVAFVDWIRPELKFDSIADLVAAVNGDVARARAILAAAGPGSAIDQRLAGQP